MTWDPEMPLAYRNQIVTGDARVLAEAIPDESIDLIFTDPPYLREYLDIYGWLSRTAMRVLKPGGYVFAYGAGEHLPERLRQMLSGGLDYFWTFVLLHNGGYPRIWHKRLMSGYKPILVFTKGAPTVVRWQATVSTVSADKRFHEWGQGEGFAIKVIHMLTTPGAVVWDPCIGGGTTAAVCKGLGRNWVAFEIDPAVAEKARDRVAATMAPLPGLIVEQMPLEEAV